jgi:hypothetical protein
LEGLLSDAKSSDYKNRLTRKHLIENLFSFL